VGKILPHDIRTTLGWSWSNPGIGVLFLFKRDGKSSNSLSSSIVYTDEKNSSRAVALSLSVSAILTFPLASCHFESLIFTLDRVGSSYLAYVLPVFFRIWLALYWNCISFIVSRLTALRTSVLSRHIFFWGGISPQTSNFPPRTWGEVCYYVNVIPVSLLSAQN